MTMDSDSRTLSPLPYQQAMVDFLKAEDPAVWQWFAERRAAPEQAAAVRLELLKSTYRIERSSQEALYALAHEAAVKLGMNLPITIYQAQHAEGLNASLAYLPGEAHIVLAGPLTTTLHPIELAALFGHELSHRMLYEWPNGDHQVAAEMLTALAVDPAAPPTYAATSRLHALSTELFCDRGAWFVTRDLAATVRVLVKVSTGLTDVCAESYLRQADEIFSQQQVTTAGVTHPESYIRARALRLWVERGDEAAEAIGRMLAGPLTLEGLDLLGQKRVAALTRRLIDRLLAPAWFQTPRVLAHARGFFEDYAPTSAAEADEALAADLATPDRSLRDYYAYVLLDFVSVDRDLEELPLAAALLLAQRLGLGERFKEIVLKELKLTKKRFQQIDSRAEELIQQEAASA